MIGDQKNFISLSTEKHRNGNVSFADNGSAKIAGKDILSLINGKGKAQNSLYGEELKHNLLSVSQIYDERHDLIFCSKENW